MQPNTIVKFREVQSMRQLWLMAILLLSALVTVAVIVFVIIVPVLQHRPAQTNPPMSPAASLVLAAVVILFEVGITLLLLSARLITEVRENGLYIKYFPFHLSFRKIPLENVQSVESVTYSPILDYGGWGIRFGRGGRAYNAMGNRGVRVNYTGRRHILIGSQRPDELADEIEAVRSQ